MLMPLELIALWIFLALLSCAAVCAYVWQRRSEDIPRAPLTFDKGHELALRPLLASRY